ncbi:MAG TPA: iron ABC transporter permease [Thermoanaerobaculia bacterium]|nr:iron ABC transporter permease [Thermoanaerobaculia bacterium]
MRIRKAAVPGALLIVVLFWLIAYPLLLVAVESVRTPDGWTLAFYEELVTHRSEWSALWASIWISIVTVLVAAIVGIPLAFLFSRFEFPGRRVLGALIALPAVLPPLVGVIAFLFLYGESGFVSKLIQATLRLEQAPWRLQGPLAILLVHAYSMYVYFYLLTRVGLSTIDPSLREAAASLGAGRWRTLHSVVIPLLRPSLAGAALLTFMASLASFSAPYLFGGGFRVMTTQIVSTRLNGNYTMAMVQTVALTTVSLIGLWLISRTERRERLGGGSKGTAPAPVRIESGTVRSAVVLASWSLALLLLLPHVTLLLLSFVPAGTWTTEAFPPDYSLRNYVSLVTQPERLRPLLNSLWMAGGAMIAAVAISLAACHLSIRAIAPGRRVIDLLLAVPWAVPGTVFAIALATLFSVEAPLMGRTILIGTIWILPLAYLVRNLPLTSRAIASGFLALDPSLEEAAASLGAGRLRTLLRVTLPLLRPALAAAATLAFVTGLGDFVTSVVLYTYDTRPLSLEILSELRQGDVGAAAAYGVLLMIISALVFVAGSERKRVTR